MVLDFNAPLELRGYEILHDDRRKVRAYLRLFNLTPRRIASFEAVIVWCATGDARPLSTPFTADQLRASARTEFTLSLSTDRFPSADHVELRFVKICFEDGTPDWTGSEADLRRIEPPEPPSGRALNALVAAAGVDAQCFAERRADCWICACGRPNPLTAERCVRCHRGRDVALQNLIPDRVLSDQPPVLPKILSPRPVGEPDIPLMRGARKRARDPGSAARLRERFVRQRGLLIRRTVTLLAFALTLALLAWAIAFLRYERQRALDVRPPVKSSAYYESPASSARSLSARSR